MKIRSWVMVLGFLLAGLTLTGAALASSERFPWEPPDGGGRAATRTPAPTPTPLAASAPQTHTVYLPLMLGNYTTFVGPALPFGYGWNVHRGENYTSDQLTTFDWIKFTDPLSVASICGVNALPYNVLLRLNYAQGDTSVQYGQDRAYEWARDLKQLSGSGSLCVKAFELGNEPNLDSMYKGPVNPADFADKLCAEYTAIKAVDPNYIVVSGGLAPTGHGPNPAQAMDEEDFLRAMLDRIRDTHQGDAGACFDVLGYHNYGFRTGYSTLVTDTVNCPDGMCFQGVERIWDILSGEYGVTKRIWLTEMGWMRDFTAQCSQAPWAASFDGFQNSDQGQATQLVGAFKFARDHWPWAGAMFVFNLDFNTRGYTPCTDEQDWFAVSGHPAQPALETMPKP